MDIAHPTCNRVSLVEFSFYQPDQLTKLSVKRITNPLIFDNLDHPAADGVYDPALGPISNDSSCATCSLNSVACPGHFGHIDLTVPVYNPITFKLLYKLMQSVCLCCHHFRPARVILATFAAKIKLVQKGLVVEASSLDSILASKIIAKPSKAEKSKKKKTSLIDDETMEDNESEPEPENEHGETLEYSIEDHVQEIESYVQNCIDENRSSGSHKSAIVTESLRRLEKEFMKSLGGSSNTCHHCDGYSPKFRHEDDVKIFQQPLNATSKAQMASRGKEFESLFGESTTALSHPNLLKEEKDSYLTPLQVRAHMDKLWANESVILDALYGTPQDGSRKSSPSIFFFSVIPVTPNRFRPVSKLGDMLFEHPQNIQLVEILKSNMMMQEIQKQEAEANAKNAENPPKLDDIFEPATDFFKRTIDAWVRLQQSVNYLIDSAKAPALAGKLPPPGIRQILEKKEGLFRKHMMGKRVNYAARSVISPDPYIETNEIGIPPVFAKKLTYPEPVTEHNVKNLRECVENGPDVWPGATHIQNEDGSLIALGSFDEAGRKALANQLLTPPVAKGDPMEALRLANTNKKVHRHLRNGDFLLLNRQPTLHKPSIMAHTARVLPGEKTIRMHYANCNTYNADFDGDEMNAHFPQNEVARAEAMLIARTDQQYLVPTDGDVLRGLIQDHVDAGVDMCSRDTFLNKAQYMQLVYIGLNPEGSLGSSAGNGNIEVAIQVGRNGRVVTLPPAILKPIPLWTGKQVISTILENLLPSDRALLNLKSKSKIPAKQWGPSAPEEQQVLIMDGYLLTGILDKSQFGASANGLVHGVFEIYGPQYAGKLLSILGRLFTGYLQTVGFTCRMDDLLLTPEGDALRSQLIAGSKPIGLEACSEFVGLPEDAKTSKLTRQLEIVTRDTEKMAGLDSAMKTRTNKVTSNIISTCIPDHLLKPFPVNNMQVMTVSGAKGSAVNVSQISCLLGQQELEGKRVPVMISGKTLPSFTPFDSSARSGGFITGRFLTGIKPQEYYFHCMAGREGLIDTAVKTSRSGYLQRCLIKHLEGLKVEYDHTVRESDGSVLQFRYGEDSLDVVKQTTLTNFDFCALNYRALVKRYDPSSLADSIDEETAKKYIKKQKRRQGLEEEATRDYTDPVLSLLSPSRFLGSVSENFRDSLEDYIEKNPANLLSTKDNARAGWSAPAIPSKKFSALMNVKYMQSLVDPGEAVGLLAAQSIGEPSTQMTLNTFHFAGFGAKNVTLGIPRLREIIMTASTAIKTPLMRLRLKEGVSAVEGEKICGQVSKLLLSQIMEGVSVTEELQSRVGQARKKAVTVRLSLWHSSAYLRQYGLTPEVLGSIIETKFIPALERAIVKDLKSNVGKKKGSNVVEEDDDTIQIGVAHKKPSSKKSEKSGGEDADDEESPKESKSKRIPDSDDEDLDDSDNEQDDGDATNARIQDRRAEKATYEGPDEDDEEMLAQEDANEEDESDSEDTLGLDELGVSREERIAGKSAFAKKYTFDSKDGKWCEIGLSFSAATKKILMVELVESVCRKVVIREVPGIQRCYPLPNDSENDKSVNLGSDGVNLTGLWQYDNVIDMSQIYSNDISAILKTFGVEAARAAIMKEIAGVFAVYGISVDPRHLSIIADYMTFEGGYKPFNRMGMGSNPSPFAQMSFETTTNFLTTATLSGDFDPLESPSARLVMGQPVRGGTGCFDVLVPLKF